MTGYGQTHRLEEGWAYVTPRLLELRGARRRTHVSVSIAMMGLLAELSPAGGIRSSSLAATRSLGLPAPGPRPEDQCLGSISRTPAGGVATSGARR